MTSRRIVAALGVLTVALMVSAVGIPAVTSGVPANQVSVTEMPGDGQSLAEPTDDVWSDVETNEIPMASAPSGLPNAGTVSVDAVNVKAARTDGELYVRMQWEDDTENLKTNSTTEFADGVAMQLPQNESTEPDIALGSQDAPVNVWYWSADTGTEELLAGGMGSITEMSDTTVETAAVHEDGTWTVVMHRSLAVDDGQRTALDGDSDIDVAFAAWDGANGERSGHHSVSEWYTYPFGPADSGPTSQYLFWAIAGTAIAVALVVSILAIRGRDTQ